MAWDTRSIDEIRDDLLAAVVVSDPDINSAEGGDAWITANALAGLILELQARDLELSRAVLPSTATGDDLDEHAAVWLGAADARRDATQWFGTIYLTATGGATPVVPINTVLTASDGTQYQTSVALAAADWTATTIEVDAESVSEVVGTVANKAVSTPLVVSAPPAGLSSAATIASTVTSAVDGESDEALRARILDVTAGRPGSGNCYDYITWAKAVSGVGEVYCYPRWDGLGHVTVAVMGPTARQHASAPAAVLTAVATAIEAERPCGAVVTVESPTADPVTVTPTLRTAAGYAPGWTGTFTTAGPAFHTVRRVYVTANPTTTIEAGDWIIVPIGANDYSCCRQVVATGTGATHWIDVSEDFADEFGTATAPAAAGGETVYPGTPNFEAVMDALFDLFDTYGPSRDATNTKQRVPDPSASGCPHAYISDIMAAIDGVEGIVSCDLTLPAANALNSVAPGAALTVKTLDPEVIPTWALV